LSWRDFLSAGIPEIGDPIALRAADKAMKEHADGR
jgi:hypothetical protein